MKIQNKNIKQIKILLDFTIGFSVGSIFLYAKRIIDLAEQVDGTSFEDFCRGFSEGLNSISFLIVTIISMMIYRKLDTGKIFSKSVIYYVQLFGILQIVSAIGAGLSESESKFLANPQSIIIGFLIIIFAQVFRVALRMQQDEELTI